MKEPYIKDAVIFSYQNEFNSLELCAIVIIKIGVNVLEKDIDVVLLESLPRYMVPREIILIEENAVPITNNGKIVKKLLRKDNYDSGQFRVIQKAAVTTLNSLEITSNVNAKYSRRFDYLVKSLISVGFDVKKPKGSFYCYVKSPIGAKGIKFATAADAAEYIKEGSNFSHSMG